MKISETWFFLETGGNRKHKNLFYTLLKCNVHNNYPNIKY